ncbi:MAG: class I SAM-dependent methyltransferase [Bacteroidia bacterium]|nr:class I SAM-dependent methyltransferase [Bacteroidia bacterium]
MEQTKNTVIATCPICGSTSLADWMSCKDFTVSKTEFMIQRCGACGFALTNPRPANENLGAYYESDEYISHSNTSKGLVSKMYQWVRKYTLRKKVEMVTSLAGKTGTLLDIGCGTGEFLNASREAGWKVTGVEPSAQARQAAKNNHGLDILDEPALATLADKSFDVITMWHVLEHVPDLPGRMQTLKRLLAPGGTLVVAVPNRNSHDAAHYEKFWAAYDVPRHLWHFRPDDIRALANTHGFEPKAIKPMVFDSYYVSMLSEKYRSGGNRYLAAVWRGFVSNRKAGAERWSSQIYILRHANA